MAAAMKNNRCQIGMLTLCVLLCIAGLAQTASLVLERHGEYLSVAAAQLHFISGKALEKLHNGSTITYAMTLTVIPEHYKKQTLHSKFAVSYDLWEENYSVSRMPDGRTASRLTAAMAEGWCLESIAIPIRSVPERQSFMIRLECIVQEEEAKDNGEPSGMIFGDLVDIFSRKKQESPQRWDINAGPFRLEELKVVGSR
jgi:hypothetical protein